jgi:hypothetical protein
MAVSVDIAHLNELIHLFGESQKAEMRAERRETMKSVLFDLPRRSSLGWQALYEHEVGFLRELSEHAAPEELGRRMRRLGSRPYALQPFILGCTYLGARQQRMLDLGLAEGDPFPEERVDDLAFLMDWWERIMRSYRSDGLLLPRQAGGALPILDDADVAWVCDLLEPAPEERVRRVRRMAATLQLYAFVLHGEQRDGIFGHGPYALPDGQTLFVFEYNDLQNADLPWAATQARLPHPSVVVAYRARDVRVRCDMFGSMVTEPLEFHDRLTGLAVLAAGDGELAVVGDEQVPAIQEAAAAAQEELYLKAIEWDDRYKVAYGAPLFANHLAPFFALAGVDGGVSERIRAACRATADRMVDELVGAAVPSIWPYIGSTEGDLFWPVVV